MQLTHLHQVKAEGLSHDSDISKRILLNEADMPAAVRLSHAVLMPGQQASAHSHAGLAEDLFAWHKTNHKQQGRRQQTLKRMNARASFSLRLRTGDQSSLQIHYRFLRVPPRRPRGVRRPPGGRDPGGRSGTTTPERPLERLVEDPRCGWAPAVLAGVPLLKICCKVA